MVPSTESLAARLDVLERQLEAARKEAMTLREENGVFRWRLAELEARAGALSTGSEMRPADAGDVKPPEGPGTLVQQQSTGAVDPLAMGQSMVSSLQDRIEAELQRAGVEREERWNEAEALRNGQSEMADKLASLLNEITVLGGRVTGLESGREKTKRETDEALGRQQQALAAGLTALREENASLDMRMTALVEGQGVTAELTALREESAALGKKVVELEKGHATTSQILRDMYYALDG